MWHIYNMPMDTEDVSCLQAPDNYLVPMGGRSLYVVEILTVYRWLS